VEVIFVQRGAAVATPSGTSIRVALKSKFSDTNFLAVADSGALDLHTTAVEDLFPGNTASADALLEVRYARTGEATRTATLGIEIQNSVILGTEGAPAAIPDGKATQAEAEAGLSNEKWMTPLRTFQSIAAWIAANLSWSTLSGKPSTFPPSAHTHATSEVTGLDTALAGVQTALNGKEPTIISLPISKGGTGASTAAAARTSLGLGAEFSSSSLQNGLLAFYNLTDTSDSSGNNKTLTDNGGVTFGPGKFGNAAILNGSSWLYRNETLSLANVFSVSCWVNITSADSLRPAVSQWQGGLGAFYIGTVNNDYVFATCHDIDVSNPTWLYGGAASLNQWVHMVGTYNGSVEKLYINNVLVASQTTFPLVNPSVGQFKIGTFDAGGEFGFSGSVDAVGIWNRALSDADVALLYNDGVRSIAGGGTGAATAAAARTNLGLGNVDNTSDAAKPISTATQAALDGKPSASQTIVNALIFG
jgi:hypothetical protein